MSAAGSHFQIISDFKMTTLVTEGKTLVTEGETLVTEGKTLVTMGFAKRATQLPAGARTEGPVGP